VTQLVNWYTDFYYKTNQFTWIYQWGANLKFLYAITNARRLPNFVFSL